MKIRPGIKLGSLTDIGCQRENNEDCYGYWEPAGDEEFARKGRLAAIADGMGGHEGGQEASRIAIETMEKIYAGNDAEEPQQLLVEGISTAHKLILKYAETHPGLQGMGTTCTAVALLDGRFVYAHIGDSRLYLVRDSKISRLTRDHSYVSRLVEAGIITSGDADTHPQRNVLTAALGAGEDVIPETPPDPVLTESGDVLLLCTDGLWGVMTDDEILSVVKTNAPQEACKRLVQLARDRGGPDNITVLAILVTG